jgi:assimilatory nitrate reductase catalytic subunit
LNVHLRQGEAINLSAAPDYPVNFGMACPKGWEAQTPLRAPDRATEPLMRNSQGELEPVSWETALRVFVERFKAIQAKHGPDSLAWLGSGQITTEELAFLGTLAKMGMGIIHGDGNTRQCMATAVTAYKESFGFDAPPYCYADFEESDVLIFIGSNLCVAHPILWQRVLRNRHQPEIIVIDPRKTETAMAANRHFAIKPKSDLVLFYGLARILIANGWIDHGYIDRHTTEFESFEKFVADISPESVSATTGLRPEQIQELAALIYRGKRVSFWWTMGINQGHEATRTAQAIINLALMTGNIGRPGTGANSITGQCNAMGSRLFSNTTNLLGGHDFENPAHREKVARVLGIDPDRVPRSNSWPYHRIVQGIGSGAIRGLWIIGTNPSHSWIDQQALNRSLDDLDFLVVQDMFTTTETARRADLILPAAGWGEKDGTFINSERRIGRIRKVARAPGKALSDFHIFQMIAHAWGCGEMFEKWSSPEAVFQILKEVSRGQPCDITGIENYAALDRAGGIQWPCPEATGGSVNEPGHEACPVIPSPPQEERARERRPYLSNVPSQTREPQKARFLNSPVVHRRLFEDGKFFRPNGRAQFVFESPRSLPEPTDSQYPFVLVTGRGSSAQWHTGTRTEKSAVLRQLRPDSVYVEINPADAARLGIKPDAMVKVSSRRGTVLARAFVTQTNPPGQVFMPMHYEAANQLTISVFDPYSHQPAYKACAVSLQGLFDPDQRIPHASAL